MQFLSKINKVIILLLILTGCEEKLIIQNLQDIHADNYLPPAVFPDNALHSFNDKSILVKFISNNKSNTAVLTRRNISTNDELIRIIIWEIDGDSSIEYLDTTGVFIDNEYIYSIRNKNNSGESKEFSDTLNHKFSSPDNFTIDQISASKLSLSWDYDQNIIDSSSISHFEIVRNSNIENDPVKYININYPIKEFTDSTITPNFQYDYSIKVVTIHNNFSESVISTHETTFPNIGSFAWTPHTLSKMELEFSLSSVSDDYLLDSLIVFRSRETDNEFILIDSTNGISSSAVFTLIDYLTEPNLAEIWWYRIKLCESGHCVSDTFDVKTLPFLYMTYIPAKNDYSFGEEENVNFDIEPFYINNYEITNLYFGSPGTNYPLVHDEDNFNYFPKDSVSIPDIISDYCNERTDELFGLSHRAYYSSSGNYNLNRSKAGFRLPMEWEWEYAATYSGNGAKRLYSFGDNISSAYANYYLSGDPWETGETPVGWYNGVNPNTEDSRSFFGIYDLNGNVKEWCHTRDFYVNQVNEGHPLVARGGAFLDDGNECSNYSRHLFHLPDIKHETIGFRTVISAIPFLDYWKETL